MLNLNSIMSELANERPIFHSEADFQHALAWKIHEELQGCTMRLEFKPSGLKSRIYLDIWTACENKKFAFELKYKTHKLDINVGNESYNLLDQIAHPCGRYDFMKDIQRLEEVVGTQGNIEGYAIFLTNDSAYWKPPRNEKNVDYDFCNHEGRILNGHLFWKKHASEGTTKGRKEPINIRGTYKLSWQNYSELGDIAYGKFKYLLIKI